MTKSIKGRARQNLLVRTVNVALQRRLITLACEGFTTATFEFELDGMPAVGRVRDINGCAIDIKANLLPTELVRHSFLTATDYRSYQKFGAATVHSFLDRIDDEKCLQVFGEYHGDASITARLARLVMVPNGFGIRHGFGPCREMVA